MIARQLGRFLVITGCIMIGWAFGNQPIAATIQAGGPHALIERMTEDLLVTMEEYRQTVNQDPEPFFQFLEERLEQIVDFQWIAGNVMGPYRKQASAEQRQRFAEVFRRSLVETYGRGLLAYSDEKIEVVAPAEDISAKRRVFVKQEIYGKTEIYPVTYTMAKNKQQQWKILNVMINGVNLGKTFRNQFVQAARNNGDDIDKVIASWSTSV